ncbi:MAG: protoporphyrinogen oxidase [Halobacteriales archaeon]
MTRVGVIGAGITGLALTHHLVEHGADPVVFEARDEPGGAVRSRRIDGHVVEYGPQRVRLTPSLRAISEAVGADDALHTAESGLPLYVYADGRLRRVPKSPREAVTTDLLTWRAKARILLEPFTDDGWNGETVGEYLTRKFGREVSERYFGLLYASIYGSDPDEMPMRYSLGSMLTTHGLDDGSILFSVAKRALQGRGTPPVTTVEGGLQTLPKAIYRAHADRVHLDTPVEAIRAAGDGYEMTADGETTTVDRVVVTAPAAVAAEVLADVAPTTAAALDELHYNPMSEVFLRSDADADGLGYQVARDADLETRGVTWNHGMFADGLPARKGVYTVYLGSDPVKWSDDRLGSVATSEFERVMDADAEVLGVHRLRRGMPAYDRSWEATERIDPPEGITFATNYTARAGIPGRLREAKQVAERLAGDQTSRGEHGTAEKRPA